MLSGGVSMAISLGSCHCFSGMIKTGWLGSGLGMGMPAPVGLAPVTNRVDLLAVTLKPSTGLPRSLGSLSPSPLMGLFCGRLFVCPRVFLCSVLWGGACRPGWSMKPERHDWPTVACVHCPCPLLELRDFRSRRHSL